jgi:hypothetical protein
MKEKVIKIKYIYFYSFCIRKYKKIWYLKYKLYVKNNSRHSKIYLVNNNENDTASVKSMKSNISKKSNEK